MTNGNFGFGHLSFVILSTFGFRHSSFMLLHHVQSPELPEHPAGAVGPGAEDEGPRGGRRHGGGCAHGQRYGGLPAARHRQRRSDLDRARRPGGPVPAAGKADQRRGHRLPRRPVHQHGRVPDGRRSVGSRSSIRFPSAVSCSGRSTIGSTRSWRRGPRTASFRIRAIRRPSAA